MAKHASPSPPDTPTLKLAYSGYAGIYNLLQLFATVSAVLQLEFSPEHFMAFYDNFRERETEIDHTAGEELESEFYWIKGENCWIRVCFEAHEGYYQWGCYTRAANIGRLRTYFEDKERNK